MTELLTAAMVEELGQYQSSNGPSFSAYQALRDVAPETLLNKILQGLLGNQEGSGSEGKDNSDYQSEVAKRTAAQRIADFRKMVEKETRRRTAENLGKERVATYGVPKLAEEVDFLRASDAELTTLKKNVAPLARLLASRLAVRRSRSRSGSIIGPNNFVRSARQRWPPTPSNPPCVARSSRQGCPIGCGPSGSCASRRSTHKPVR